jgi:hypothetical protein
MRRSLSGVKRASRVATPNAAPIFAPGITTFSQGRITTRDTTEPAIGNAGQPAHGRFVVDTDEPPLPQKVEEEVLAIRRPWWKAGAAIQRSAGERTDSIVEVQAPEVVEGVRRRTQKALKTGSQSNHSVDWTHGRYLADHVGRAIQQEAPHLFRFTILHEGEGHSCGRDGSEDDMC